MAKSVIHSANVTRTLEVDGDEYIVGYTRELCDNLCDSIYVIDIDGPDFFLYFQLDAQILLNCYLMRL